LKRSEDMLGPAASSSCFSKDPCNAVAAEWEINRRIALLKSNEKKLSALFV
jgi:hypothetical protein